MLAEYILDRREQQTIVRSTGAITSHNDPPAAFPPLAQPLVQPPVDGLCLNVLTTLTQSEDIQKLQPSA
ncbi:MAG: hypothetical protein PVF85_04605 [Anaerolineales bacterium]|jgi:hypothetical protein